MSLRYYFRRLTQYIKSYCRPVFWFVIGFFFAASILLSGVLIYFQNRYENQVIPGVFVDNTYVGGKTKEEVAGIFEEQNNKISETTFTFESDDDLTATISAEELELGYDSELIAQQAIQLGQGENILSSFYIIIDTYMNTTTLPSSYSYSEETLEMSLEEIAESVHEEPVNALFTVQGNKVTAFQESKMGKKLDSEKVFSLVKESVPQILKSNSPLHLTFSAPITIVEPEVTTKDVNDLGIVEEIGRGKSYFRGSDLNRIHNVSLAASRVNGILVAPGETFSFNENLGDVSRYTGYKEAYVISGGRTVLGDGGGVCQVSTTLFRAILNSGMPVEERHPHSYRVSYYEQQSPPGLDATIYVPTVDLKFSNDSENYILIQSHVDPSEQSLTFTFYGKSDGREVEVTEPVILSQSPPPEPLYEDDPELPEGEVKQVDFAAPGAVVEFSRTVTRDDEVLLEDNYRSVYTPWRAVYRRGV